MVLEVRTDRCDEPLKQPLHGDVVNGLGVVTGMVHLGRPSTKGHPRVSMVFVGIGARGGCHLGG